MNKCAIKEQKNYAGGQRVRPLDVGIPFICRLL